MQQQFKKNRFSLHISGMIDRRQYYVLYFCVYVLCLPSRDATPVLYCITIGADYVIWPVAFHFSRSLKVIGTDTDRSATKDFLWVTHSNHGHMSYRFRDKQRKVQIFPTVYLTPPLRGLPLEFCNVGEAQKTRMMPYQTTKKCYDMSIRLHTFWQTDRQNL